MKITPILSPLLSYNRLTAAMLFTKGTKVRSAVSSRSTDLILRKVGDEGIICGPPQEDERGRVRVPVEWKLQHKHNFMEIKHPQFELVSPSLLDIEESTAYGPVRGKNEKDDIRAEHGLPVYVDGSEKSLQELVMEELWADERKSKREQLMKDWKNAAVKAALVVREAYELRMEGANTQDEEQLLAKINAAARALNCLNHRANSAGMGVTNPVEMSASWKIHHELLEVGVEIFRSGLCWQETPKPLYNLVSGPRPGEYTYTSADEVYDRSHEGIKQRAELERELRFTKSWALAAW